MSNPNQVIGPSIPQPPPHEDELELCDLAANNWSGPSSAGIEVPSPQQLAIRAGMIPKKPLKVGTFGGDPSGPGLGYEPQPGCPTSAQGENDVAQALGANQKPKDLRRMLKVVKGAK